MGFQIFLWELCVCIKYLSLGDAKYLDAIQEYDWVTGKKAA